MFRTLSHMLFLCALLHFAVSSPLESVARAIGDNVTMSTQNLDPPYRKSAHPSTVSLIPAAILTRTFSDGEPAEFSPGGCAFFGARDPRA